MTSEPTVGIIANPASGKDIRRLVAHGSTFDNNEKVNIVRRILLGLDAVGVRRVLYLPDLYGIVLRAAEPLNLALALEALPMPVLGNPGDSREAAMRLRDASAGCIVTLGGDGTNRMVALGCGEIPLMPVSTGTNNVFPRMVEGTLAGLAAGIAATDVNLAAIEQRSRLAIAVNGVEREIALIDVVVSTQQWIGARAFWEPAHLNEIVLSRVSPAEIGICGLGGLLFPDATGSGRGVHARIGPGTPTVLTPLAPGLLREVTVREATLIDPCQTVDLEPLDGTIALDGEREFEVSSEQRLSVTLDPDGPRVIDLEQTLTRAAAAGRFLR